MACTREPFHSRDSIIEALALLVEFGENFVNVHIFEQRGPRLVFLHWVQSVGRGAGAYQEPRAGVTGF